MRNTSVCSGRARPPEEKGAFYASLKIIGKLAEALGVELAELLKRGSAERKHE